MRGVHLFMFLVALPAIAALGHDCYLYYLHQDKGFDLAALGFILTNYEPDYYKQLVETTQPMGYWDIINEILAQKAVYVGIAFAGFFYVILGILKLLGVWPFNDPEIRNFTGNKRLDEMMGKNKGKKAKFKYNRK